jgi:hypothetical protein
MMGFYDTIGLGRKEFRDLPAASTATRAWPRDLAIGRITRLLLGFP